MAGEVVRAFVPAPLPPVPSVEWGAELREAFDRALITLLLCVEGVLAEPLLYLSLYRKQHRQRYYELLGATRSRGDWESWLAFFAEAVAETAAGAVETAQAIAQLFRADREKLAGLGRSASSAMRVHHALQSRPLCSIASMSASLALSVPTVTKALESLQRTGIVREITRRQRGRLFVYDAYLALLNCGTEATAVPPRATG